MAKRYSGPKTYGEVIRFLNGRDSRVWKGLKATTFHKERDLEGNPCVCMEYWRTDVVTWLQNGDVIINTGGWHTNTTQHRLNAAVRVWGRCEYFEHGGLEYEMSDGALLKTDGTVEGAIPLIVRDWNYVTGQNLETIEACNASLARLNFNNTKWIWNKLRRHRRWIAANCSNDFLPTLIGFKGVEDIIGKRLKKAA